MDEIGRRPARTVAELASASQHQENWPTIMELEEIITGASL
jgi:hypothetical protein